MRHVHSSSEHRMYMRCFGTFVLLAFILTTFNTLAADRPNILLLVADDLGWGDVAYHKGNVPTPSLDRLTKEGTQLNRFYAYPVCSPTRAALLSGQMSRRFGIVTPLMPREPGLPGNIATLPKTFASAGYTTSLIGKWHIGTAAGPLKSGFDHFYGFMGPEIDYFQHTNKRGLTDWQRDGQTVDEKGYSTDLIANEAIRQISSRDAKRPFFIEVAFNAVHFPQAAPDETIAKYKDRGNGATYAAMIECLDTAIGRIVKTLDDQNLRDNTLVVFFSDNGADQAGSNQPLRRGKGSVFEGGIRTPAIIRWPGKVPADATNQQPIATHDLFPTLAEAAGIEMPREAKLDGSTQWKALREGKTIPRDPFLIATEYFAAFDGQWKLIEMNNQRALYDVNSDISETTDLITRESATAKRLGDKLDAWKKELPAVTVTRPGPPGGGGRPPARN